MKKPKKDRDKWLKDQCEKYGIDPDWYETKRELYQVIANCTAGRTTKWRKISKKKQNQQINHEPILDKNGETHIPKYKPNTWMWD